MLPIQIIIVKLNMHLDTLYDLQQLFLLLPNL